MKKFIFTAVIIVIVGVGLGFLTMAVYTRYKQKLNNTPAPVAMVSAASAESRVNMLKKAAYAHYETMMTANTALLEQCNKGKVAYDKLSSAQKQTTPAPTCVAAETISYERYFDY